MPQAGGSDSLLSNAADEEFARLRSSSDDTLGLRYEGGAPQRGCGARCRGCARSCADCLRTTWGCCGELWCGIGPEICKLLCMPPLPSRIASKLAFAPPPPSYDIVSDAQTGRMQLWLQQAQGGLKLFVPNDTFGASPSQPASYTLDVDWLRTQSKQHVPGIFLRPTRATRQQACAAGRGPKPNPNGTTEAADTDYFVFFFSHANGVTTHKPPLPPSTATA